ncbi:MAG TPA: hypothetical protein VHE34_05730 [Puia sp.]|uniref:hypothetical protein n=1 Tax=Puia sp. TaxID=2045100 RepID=UPI002D06D8BB|nr:hypothetical protein [Puia sp.]HVU94701.1 hypothetical protein [Puia sp.]
MTRYILILACALSAAFSPRSRDTLKKPDLDAPRGLDKDTIKFLDWEMLQDISGERRYVEALKGHMEFPVFPPKIKILEGTIVEVAGYVIPADRNGSVLSLSANPYSACYFCGNGGPASVLTLLLKNDDGYDRYHIDDYKAFKGKLRLNSKDIDQLYYTLEDAVEVKE